MNNFDDFEKMSFMSKGSIRSKTSTVRNQIGYKKPLVFIDVNLGKEKGK